MNTTVANKVESSVSVEHSVSEEIEIFEALKNRDEEPVELALFDEGVAFGEALSIFTTQHLHCLPAQQPLVQAVFQPRVDGVVMLPLRKCYDELKRELQAMHGCAIECSVINAAYRSFSVPFFSFMKRRETKDGYGRRTESSCSVKYSTKGAKVSHAWRIDPDKVTGAEKGLARAATAWCSRLALEVVRRPALVKTLKTNELELVLNSEELPAWLRCIRAQVAEVFSPKTKGVKADKAAALVMVKDAALLELRRRERGADEGGADE